MQFYADGHVPRHARGGTREQRKQPPCAPGLCLKAEHLRDRSSVVGVCGQHLEGKRDGRPWGFAAGLRTRRPPAGGHGNAEVRPPGRSEDLGQGLLDRAVQRVCTLSPEAAADDHGPRHA
eukprot:CAMPEP_0175221038 /NCGR_PEP_ID=MMETSP0093-20121207/20099_1 /TAXON_ID=311494 /ORGANISM="Alexandrium monilatum, Strain CCMP3105" /LENGTH=119 /DNA_ID=CAMNT_0016514575 /DNA_START=370 /DNA_END=725 /DNA_ORIENTATION=-